MFDGAGDVGGSCWFCRGAVMKTPPGNREAEAEAEVGADVEAG